MRGDPGRRREQVRLKGGAEGTTRGGDFGAENAGRADDNGRGVLLSAAPALARVIS